MYESEDFIFSLLPHGTRIQDNNISLNGVEYFPKSRTHERHMDFFGVCDIHLTSERFDVVGPRKHKTTRVYENMIAFQENGQIHETLYKTIYSEYLPISSTIYLTFSPRIVLEKKS